MFAFIYRRRINVPPKGCIFAAQRAHDNTVLVRSCSSSVCENASEKAFSISYLINTCGISSNNAVSISNKPYFNLKSPENPDAVLKLLREYGFTDAHISGIVTRLPKVLLSCPKKTLLPKLRFFRSIGVPKNVLAQKLSLHPSILTRNLENSLIPSYNVLKALLGSDEKVITLFSRAPGTFGRCCSEGISSNISMLRERGVPQSTIVSLAVHQPNLLVSDKKRLAEYVDRAIEIGFDVNKIAFFLAVRVFYGMTESTLKNKMEAYRRYGWTKSDVNAAFLKHPICMNLSEKKITVTMDFLVNVLGCKPVEIAQCPMLLGYSLDKRIRPRCLVARVLKDKGLKNVIGLTSLLIISEEKFLKKYIIKYENDIPELLDIYRGKLGPSETGGF
ncbi:hypothetical protein CASFOL_008961 [Castilleja foliolosa]|uniref:Mitochondrial transcription termination factor family protein n=1 Tax=Castilleja foliolosa TaxID=1961234 RepID=A0ABD3E0H0_9LAMI